MARIESDMSRTTALIILSTLALAIIWMITQNTLSEGWFATLTAGASGLVALAAVGVAAIALVTAWDLARKLRRWMFPSPPPWDRPVVVDEATSPALVGELVARLEPVREYIQDRKLYLRDRDTGQLWEQYTYDFEFYSFRRLTPVQEVPEKDVT